MNAEVFVTFFLAFIVSALGSVPLGTINLTTIQISANYGMKQALKFIMIAAVAEVLHVWIALWLEGFVRDFPIVDKGFKYASVLFILLIGMINLFKEPVTHNPQGSFSFYKSLMINIFNPFSVPFWLFFTAYLHQNGWIPAHFSRPAYFIGTSAGAAVTLSLYAGFGNFLTRRKVFERINVDRMVGIVLLGMGVYKLF